jgi:cytochrome P450
LSFNTNTALKGIYGANSNVVKSQFYTALWHGKTESSANTHNAIDRTIHARKRRVLAQAFTDSSLKGMESYMLASIDVFCAQISPGSTNGAKSDSFDKTDPREWSQGRNMANLCTYLTFDVLGDLCFGKSFDLLTTSTNRFMLRLVQLGSARSVLTGSFLPLRRWALDKYLFPGLVIAQQTFRNFAGGMAISRSKMGVKTDRKDFYYYLLSAKDPQTGSGYSSHELWAESSLLIAAGADTSSTALSASFHYLLHNPRTLQKLVKEIRSTFQDSTEIISGSKLNSCIYLRACIEETLRMAAPIPGILPREVLPGGLEIDGEHIPAGVEVGVAAQALHYNPAYFPDRNTFRPERWIAENDEARASIALATSAFCPFSIGSRGCIAKKMAYAELSLALARTVWEFDMRLAEGTKADPGMLYKMKDALITIKDGPMVEFAIKV